MTYRDVSRCNELCYLPCGTVAPSLPRPDAPFLILISIFLSLFLALFLSLSVFQYISLSTCNVISSLSIRLHGSFSFPIVRIPLFLPPTYVLRVSSRVDFKEFFLSSPPTSSCDIKHLSNVFAMLMSKEAIRSLEQWNFNVFHVGLNEPVRCVAMLCAALCRATDDLNTPSH